MRMLSTTVSLLLAACALAGAMALANAQMSHGTMQHGGMHGAATAQDTPASKAFKEAAARMHRDMAIAYTGDADVDFVKGMIPHHQAAIDMAKIELQYGKDEQTRKLAEAIIKAQEAEIADMKAWLKARGQ
ncbi:MAG: DUF305 domain-containing protein [Alsobacter sp.]